MNTHLNRIIAYLFIGIFHLIIIACGKPVEELVQEGDIIFHTSQSAQSQAIRIVTQSDYSHMGIIFENEGKFYVYEAVKTVKHTPLDKWIARGKDQHYVIKRLKNADHILTPETKKKMWEIGETFRGKSYDISFEWSDDRIYCSELVWKIYQRATGIEIGQREVMGDFDLSHPIVAAKVKERFGNNIPLNEPVISPQAMFESELLETVISQ